MLAVLNQPPPAPTDRLSRVFTLGLKIENEAKGIHEDHYIAPVGCIDLDFESESTPTAPEPKTYETVYVTSHKGMKLTPLQIIKSFFIGGCRAGAFNLDGSLVATGSQDAS